MMGKVRQALTSDYSAVMKLMQKLNPDDSQSDTAISNSVFSEILNSSNLQILLIENNEEVVGTCYLNIIPNLTRSARPYAVIENVVINPELHGCGFGKIIVKAAIQQAFDNDCYKVMLMTGRDEGVRQFYEKCGMNSSSKSALIIRND